VRGRRWLREAFTSVAIGIHRFSIRSGRAPDSQKLLVRLGSQPLRRYRRKSNGDCGFAEEALQRSRKRFQVFKHLLKV